MRTYVPNKFRAIDYQPVNEHNKIFEVGSAFDPYLGTEKPEAERGRDNINCALTSAKYIFLSNQICPCLIKKGRYLIWVAVS